MGTPLDTDDLSGMAYECLSIAERTNHLIALHLGVMARDHKDENAYLKAISEWAKEIRHHWSSSLLKGLDECYDATMQRYEGKGTRPTSNGSGPAHGVAIRQAVWESSLKR